MSMSINICTQIIMTIVKIAVNILIRALLKYTLTQALLKYVSTQKLLKYFAELAIIFMIAKKPTFLYRKKTKFCLTYLWIFKILRKVNNRRTNINVLHCTRLIITKLHQYKLTLLLTNCCKITRRFNNISVLFNELTFFEPPQNYRQDEVVRITIVLLQSRNTFFSTPCIIISFAWVTVQKCRAKG